LPTINSQLRDFLLKRSHYVYSFENGAINDIVQPYNNAKAEIMKSITDLEDYGQGWTLPYRMDRLNARVNEIDMVLKNATQDSIANLSDSLNTFAMSEKDYVETMLSNPFGQIGINITRLPYEQIYEVVNTPIGGAMYHERMAQRYGEAMFNIKSNLTQSIIQGDDMAKASRYLLGSGKVFGGVVGARLMQQSTVIARTEIMRVSNAVSERVYNENQDVLKGVSWISTLDNRTCPACGSLDGRIFYFNKGSKPPQRPLHPMCRCTLVPCTKSWKELGADQKLEEPDAGTRPFTYIGEKPPKGSRQYLAQQDKWAGDVPATEKYPDWLRRMNVEDPDFVKDILGTKRYEMWSSGQIDFQDMVKNNKVLKLSDLEGKAGKGLALEIEPTTKFIPIKTAEEGRDALRQFKISSSYAEGVDSKTFVKVVNQSGEVLDDLFVRFPGLGKNLENKWLMSFDILKGKTLRNSNLLGRFGWNESKLEIASSLRSSPSVLKIGKGVFNTGNDFPAVLRHEYGHFFHRSIIGMEENKAWGEIWAKGTRKAWFEKNITKYAGTDFKEAFTESFTIYTHPQYKPGILPKEIESFFDKLLLPKKGIPLEAISPTSWQLGDKINAVTMGDFVTLLKGKKWEEVARHLNDVLKAHPLDVAQHNLNEVNVMRYLYKKGMTTAEMKTQLAEYADLVKSRLYGKGLPVEIGEKKMFSIIPREAGKLDEIDLVKEWRRVGFKDTNIVMEAGSPLTKIMGDHWDTRITMAKAGHAWNTIVEKAPSLVAKFNKIGMPKLEFSIRKYSTGEFGWAGTYDFKRKAITLGMHGADRPVGVLRLGSRVAGESPDGYFLHELGHHLYYGDQKIAKGWDTLASKFGNSEKKIKSYIKKNISDYASTNNRESFAEAFAARLNDGYDLTSKYGSATRLPKEIESFFDEFFLKEKALPIKTIQPIPAELEAKMTARQIAAHKNAWVKTAQDHSITEISEKEVAQWVKGDWITGNRPFDVFVDREFIEVKTVLNNSTGYNHQIQMHVESIPKKIAFENKYKVRPHTVVIDKTPGSETYGKVFYREGHAKFLLKTMTEVGDSSDPLIGEKLTALVKKWAKPVPAPAYARVITPEVTSLKKAEVWAQKNLGVKKVDFDNLETKTADLFNQYAKGAIEELKIKPSAIRFDSSLFTGANKRVVALSFEDGTVAFNPNLIRTAKELQAVVKQQSAIGQFATDSKGHIFRHELAHQRYFQLGGTEASAARKINVKELYKAIGRTDLPDYVSKYAMRNEGEFYAEMLAKRLDGVKLHPVVEKFMNDIERRISKGAGKSVVGKGLPAKKLPIKVKPVINEGLINEIKNLPGLSAKGKSLPRGRGDYFDVEPFFKNKVMDKKEADKLANWLEDNWEIKGKTKVMVIDNLIPGQRLVRKEGVINKIKGVEEEFSEYPLIVRYKGKDYIMDGHHRIMAERFKNIKQVKVEFLNYDLLKGVK